MSLPRARPQVDVIASGYLAIWDLVSTRNISPRTLAEHREGSRRLRRPVRGEPVAITQRTGESRKSSFLAT
jgi:hypothetical protein